MSEQSRDERAIVGPGQPIDPLPSVTADIREHLAKITHNAVEVTPLERLTERIARGDRLTVKLGCDPSRPDLHLGHAVVLRKVRELQDLGHNVVFIVGDFTATIGDPTGKSKTRPALTIEETRENTKTYVDQAVKILDSDPEKLTIKFNSEWLQSLSFQDVIQLAGKTTVARMLERDDFKKRYKAEQPIALHEFLYPLAQGYDSVAVDADIEIGGTDQTFNLMVGRQLQRDSGKEPQIVLTMPLLPGLDGKEKMSKSLGNYIGISESPERMFEKAMKIPDAILPDYIRLLSDEPDRYDFQMSPYETHLAFAREITTTLHSVEQMEAAEARYREVASKQVPDHMETIVIPANELPIGICELAHRVDFATSRSDARKLIQGRGLRIDGEFVADPREELGLDAPIVLQRGKSRFIRVESSQ